MFKKLRGLLSDKAHSESPLEDSPAAAADDAALRSQWQSTQVGGRVVDFFTPVGESAPTDVVLFLHGHGGIRLADNPVYSRLLQTHNLYGVAPDGGQSWWLDLPSPDFTASDDPTPMGWLTDQVVPFIADQWQIEPPRIALLGVSMGGQGVLQLSYRQALKFPVVAAISPAVDFHQLWGTGIPLDKMFTNEEAARQETVVLNLHPLSWPRHQFFCCDPLDVDWFDGAARLGMKLSSSGVLHERDLDTSAGGHSWDYFNHMAPVAFEHIVKGLQSFT
jgi:pimeloyl-ACP methyl ester carboxylesterase